MGTARLFLFGADALHSCSGGTFATSGGTTQQHTVTWNQTVMLRQRYQPRTQLTIGKDRDYGAALSAHGGFRGLLRVRAPDYPTPHWCGRTVAGVVMGSEHAERPARGGVRALRVSGPRTGSR